MLQVIPSPATSAERVLLQPASAARSVLEMARLAIGCSIPMLPTAMIRPQRRSRIPGRRRLATWIGESTAGRNQVSSISGVSPSAVPGGGPPWFRKRMSTPPSAASAPSARASMSAAFATSAGMPTALGAPRERSESQALSRLACSRPEMASATPSAARASATERPRPLEAPITSARLPRRPRSIGFSLPVRFRPEAGPPAGPRQAAARPGTGQPASPCCAPDFPGRNPPWRSPASCSPATIPPP